MSPLRDTMCLVYGIERNLDGLEKGDEGELYKLNDTTDGTTPVTAESSKYGAYFEVTGILSGRLPRSLLQFL